MKRVGKYALHQNPFIFRGEKEAERRVYISTRVSQAEKYGGVFVKVEEGHFPSPISFFSAGREHDPLLYGYTLSSATFYPCKVVLFLPLRATPSHDCFSSFFPNWRRGRCDQSLSLFLFLSQKRNVAQSCAISSCKHLTLRWLEDYARIETIAAFFPSASSKLRMLGGFYLPIDTRKGDIWRCIFRHAGNIRICGRSGRIVFDISLWRRVISRR